MADPSPAPGEDQHRCLALVNTRYERGGHVVDLLDTPDTALTWLNVAVDGVDPQATATAVWRLRDAVRALLVARSEGAEPPEGALEAVNQALRAAPTVPRLHWLPTTAPELRRLPLAGNAVEHALAALALDTVRLLTGPNAELVIACGASGCLRLFLRARPGQQWCSNRCGDRVRAARHYARTKGEPVSLPVPATE